MTKANAAYQNQQYETAVALYEHIAADGNEGYILYYNLGNAYYKSGELAKARLWYERAARLSPNNEDIEHNIAFVSQKCVDKIEVMPELFFVRWWNGLSGSFRSQTWAIASIVCAFLTLFGVALLLISRRRVLRTTALTSAILCAFLLIFCIIFAHKEQHRYTKQPEAVVMAAVVTAKSTPDKGSNDLFVIHEGLKVVITDTLNEWVEIRLPNGEKGWIRSAEIERI